MAERIVRQVYPLSKLPPLPNLTKELRVAAYARVSTDSDEQMGSVAAQKDYFEKLIRKKPNWIFVGIYADEGISGTSLNHREAFGRMITDALNGKIDLIITKSLSRFARNTVDTLNTIRALKAKRIAVYFEKEDINTLDSKGEFLITLMSSIAEEESRSISENVKWGQRKRFADGKYSVPYKNFLGYKKGADGKLELIEDEAKIIRLIYRLYIEGESTSSIAEKLTNTGIVTPSGLQIWQRTTIESILHNEKYYGAALMQKSFVIDYRTKKKKKNCGELLMYYIENGHEAIVSKEIYNEIQEKINKPGRLHRTALPFSNMIYCGECGALYGPIQIHSTTYNDIAWKCYNRYIHSTACNTPHLYEELLKPIFHEIIMMIFKNNPSVIRECVTVLNTVKNNPKFINKNRVMDLIDTYDINSDAEVRLWKTIIQKVVVHPGYLLEFHIIDGSIMQYKMKQTSLRQNRLSDTVILSCFFGKKQSPKCFEQCF